jgi:flagellar hook-basal body complex protein FliE
MTTAPIQALSAVAGLDGTQIGGEALAAGRPTAAGAFANLLLNGVNQVNQKVTSAETMATSFALDDSVPLHEVTFALQQARLSLEFMLQVRNRLVEAYQQFASMQL